MYEKIKCLELTNHQMIKKTASLMEETSEKKNDNVVNLIEVVFSSALSLFIAFLTEKYIIKDMTPSTIKSIVIFFIVAVVLYCILFIVTKTIYSFITRKVNNLIFNKRSHSVDVSQKKIDEIIADFDNIAFDNLIISENFIKGMKSNSDINLRTYYFHEALYYLRIAMTKTIQITDNYVRERTLNIKTNTTGVDVFRLYNAYHIMKQLYTTLSSEFSLNESNYIINTYTEELEECLAKQLMDLDKNLIEIETRCQKALADLNKSE